MLLLFFNYLVDFLLNQLIGGAVAAYLLILVFGDYLVGHRDVIFKRIFFLLTLFPYRSKQISYLLLMFLLVFFDLRQVHLYLFSGFLTVFHAPFFLSFQGRGTRLKFQLDPIFLNLEESEDKTLTDALFHQHDAFVEVITCVLGPLHFEPLFGTYLDLKFAVLPLFDTHMLRNLFVIDFAALEAILHLQLDLNRI